MKKADTIELARAALVETTGLIEWLKLISRDGWDVDLQELRGRAEQLEARIAPAIAALDPGAWLSSTQAVMPDGSLRNDQHGSYNGTIL